VRTRFPEPTEPIDTRAGVLLRYLDYFRARAIEKVTALPEQEASRSRLPSGWTPQQLLVHLRHVERRWLVWGFAGEQVADPWGDQRDGRWQVPAGASTQALVDALAAQGERSREIVAGHRLDEAGQPGPRWDGAEPATLERVLLHLVQEYARHLGQLDVVAELAGGPTGE